MKLEKRIYTDLLSDITTRIYQSQRKALASVNAELISLYWDIGKIIHERQVEKGWGSAIIPNLAKDLHNELSEVKGFSERNLKRMLRFFREYSPQNTNKSEDSHSKSIEEIKVPHVVAQLPWGHNILLFEKIKDLEERFWYAERVASEGWSRNTLLQMVRNESFKRKGQATTNFDKRLPSPQSGLAQQTLKDPYVFDFLTLPEPFKERELENELLKHLEKFLIELGGGFSFVGRQYRIEISDKDFYIDLLFYHLHLRAFVVIDLKRGEFKPEYAGKMNFYCSVVDDKLRYESDQPTIGLILCQTKDRILAEYALRGIQKPIGVSEYELTRALPDNLKSSLPSIEELEAELSQDIDNTQIP